MSDLLDRSKSEVEKPDRILRFGKADRIEHSVQVVTFMGLGITGLVQKFFESGFSKWVIELFGGLPQIRVIHRWLATILMLAATEESAFHGATLLTVYALGIGILGEYVTRIYDQVRARPLFIVARKVNFFEPGETTVGASPQWSGTSWAGASNSQSGAIRRRSTPCRLLPPTGQSF